MTKKGFTAQLYAGGEDGMPDRIKCKQANYNLLRILKYDFFAGTALYQISPENAGSGPELVVLKLARSQSLWGIPLDWLGKKMCRHETKMLKMLKDLDQVPRLCDKYGKLGFIYEYIPGKSLAEKDIEIPDGFFDKLQDLLNKIHARNIIYLDMNKRGNIIVGDDGKPNLVDFQVSQHISDKSFLFKKISRHIRKKLIYEDNRHLLKHKKKLRLDELTYGELLITRKVSALVKIHRIFANPYRWLRRNIMRFLYKHGLLMENDSTEYNSETDPQRWAS